MAHGSCKLLSSFFIVLSVRSMMKIGRNDPCPCGSGKKYKHCCLNRPVPARQQAREPATILTLLKGEIARLQQKAARHEAAFWEVGVFLLFSTAEGDAWFLEITESDAVQVACGGQAIELPIEGQDATIAINWSHTFKLAQRQLQLSSYTSDEVLTLPLAPSQQISAAIRRIKKRYDQALLNQVHMAGEQPAGPAPASGKAG